MPVSPATQPNNAQDFLTATLNSVGATKNLSNLISTESKGTQAERALQVAGQSLQSHQDQINSLLKNQRAIQFLFNNPPAPTLLATVLPITLTAATTTTITANPPINEGDQLWVIVTAAGPTALLAWDATLFKYAMTEFDSTTLTQTIFRFFGTNQAGGGTARRLWVQDGLPYTGLT